VRPRQGYGGSSPPQNEKTSRGSWRSCSNQHSKTPPTIVGCRESKARYLLEYPALVTRLMRADGVADLGGHGEARPILVGQFGRTFGERVYAHAIDELHGAAGPAGQADHEDGNAV